MDDRPSKPGTPKVKFVRPEILVINITDGILNELPEGNIDNLYIFAGTDS